MSSLTVSGTNLYQKYDLQMEFQGDEYDFELACRKRRVVILCSKTRRWCVKISAAPKLP